MTITGGGPTVNRATYTSAAVPAPGFSVAAPTVVGPVVVIAHSVVVSTPGAPDPPVTSPGSTARYTSTITNVGTGLAGVDTQSFISVTLPAGFSVIPGTSIIDGVIVTDPTPGPGNTILYDDAALPFIPAGGATVLDFQLDVGVGVSAGLYTIDLQTQFDDPGFGRDVETSSFAVAPLLVNAPRSDPPVLDEPVIEGATAVTGITGEATGTTITLFVNGNPVPPVISLEGGFFSVPVPTLFAGQHLTATARAVAEIESLPSSPDVVVGQTDDKDGDGMSNDFEIAHGLDPLDPADAALDSDGDGFTNLEEFLAGTDPQDAGSVPPHCDVVGTVVGLRVIDDAASGGHEILFKTGSLADHNFVATTDDDELAVAAARALRAQDQVLAQGNAAVCPTTGSARPMGVLRRLVIR